MPCLVAAFETEVRTLLAASVRADPARVTDRFARHVHERLPAMVAAGTPVATLDSADRTLREASHVLAAIDQAEPGATVQRLEDVHIRGLLTMLADDDRVRSFAERELAPLREAGGSPRGGDLLRILRILIEYWTTSHVRPSCSTSLGRCSTTASAASRDSSGPTWPIRRSAPPSTSPSSTTTSRPGRSHDDRPGRWRSPPQPPPAAQRTPHRDGCRAP
jgi:hypothetical protein